MERRALYGTAPLLVAGVGLVLFVTAATHHATEISTVSEATGPLIAFAVDGLPALGLVLGGYLLSNRSFEPENGWLVFLATVSGGLIVVGVIGLGILVRAREGRPISEPAFQLLIGATAGAVAGFVGGFFYADSREKAMQATRARGTLSFTNSVLRHDIKNDMTVIRGRAKVITDADPGDRLIAESAGTIVQQADQVVDLIDSTSAISETLSDDPDYKPIDLSTVVEDVAEHARDAYTATVTTDVPESAEILANEAVRTIVSNLVENGIEHNDASDPSVHVAVEPTTEHVQLRVSDNGPGIPDEHKERIFDPRPDDTGKGGLHVVGTLAENFRGSIRVEDNEPRGTRFVVDLPRPSSQITGR